MQIPLLQDVIVILSLSVLVVLAFYRFKLPSIIGFLATGILIGPNGLSLVHATHEVELLAEIGVILLLFVIGLELSLKQLIAIRKTVFIGGAIQVGLTILAAIVTLVLFKIHWASAVFIGFLFSLSSTAVVLRILQEKNEINAPHGRISLGILIFQDIVVVPMMLITPILAGNSENVALEVLMLLLKTIGVLVITLLSAKYVVPKLFYLVTRTRSKDLFILTTIAVCFLVAFLTSFAGLSLALGAFLAGLIISESEYSHQATSNIIPFRELFTSFFFVSIGMLLDMNFLLSHLALILFLAVIVIFLKAIIAGLAAAFLRFPFRVVILTGLSLFQVGEFSFILSQTGIKEGLLSSLHNQYFLSVSIITMGITPFILLNSEQIFRFLLKLPIFKQFSLKQTPQPASLGTSENSSIDNHLVIIGYGVNGRNVSRAARYANIPTLIVELNMEAVLEGKERGEKMVYGDATQEHILHEVQLENARVAVIAISDPQATKTMVANIRNLSPTVYLIVRTRFVKETDELLNLGADEVIPEEFETSIEIFARALQKFLVPINDLDKLVQDIRSDNYQMLRPIRASNPLPQTETLPNFNIECVRVIADSGEVVGKTIHEANIRKNYSVNILAISRNGELISNITPELKILQNDLLYLSGNTKHIAAFYKEVN
ncbi:MAG: cation:proton antiporter [Sphingobacteriales bacterium]|nr:MAG: cation:proton antiporter [Sphingobacteriales bacterium]